ncbi:MAG: hypothetical protein H0W64_12590 [Gammaproteobacteria bacterium]|nr:hypothetical protein [Gammaproteobacteria bacterium]
MTSFRLLKKKHKIWFFSFIGFQLIFLCGTLLINPYRLMPFSVTIVGLNDIKPKLYDHQRWIKLFDIAHIKPKTVLLGSSRILWGLDPKHPLLNDPAYQPVYNAGILGPPIYEVERYFKHALAMQPNIKRIILGLDFYAFNQKFDGRTFDIEKSFGKNERELLLLHKNLVYDLSAIFKTIRYSFKRKYVKTIRQDGRLTPAPLDAPVLYKDFFTLNKLPLFPIPPGDPKVKPKEMKSVLYDPFQLSEVDLKALQNMINVCEERNIELLIFMTPSFAQPGIRGTEIEVFHSLNIWEDYKTLLKKISTMHPFWSFVGPNEITSNKANFIDSSHYVFAVGDKIISKMLNVTDKTIPKKFGRYINSTNVDSYLQDLETEYIRNL